MTRPVILDAELGARAAQVETSVRSLVSEPGARGLEGLARFLLRSEAIASSLRLLGVSFPAARKAVEELAEAKILSRKQVEQNTTGYLARDVFDLLTVAERRLASTRWDTRQSRPARPVPAGPTAGS